MGGNTSKLQGLKIDKERWSKMESKPDYDVMWDKDANEAQLYKFILDETMDIDNEIDVNNYRAKNDGNHVQVIGAEETEAKVGLCGKQKNVEVLTERIPTLLADSRQLSFDETNIVLYNALKGYSRLSDKFGPIEVTDQMIGFNAEGNTKVWINENFGRNHPISSKDADTQDLTGLKSSNEERMVRNIINIVERKCERGQFPEPFRTDLYRSTSFSDTLRFIQSANVAPFSALESNRIVLNRIIEQPNYRQTQPAPMTYSAKPSNARVSFNYISPTN